MGEIRLTDYLPIFDATVSGLIDCPLLYIGDTIRYHHNQAKIFKPQVDIYIIYHPKFSIHSALN